MRISEEKYQQLKRELNLPSDLQSIFIEEIKQELIFKRDDLINPIVCGNKWRKLSNHLNFFQSSDKQELISMGGAFSNHLHALAYVCFKLEIPCTCLIYGWNNDFETPTLKDCRNWNATLIPISRVEAQQLRLDPKIFLEDRFSNALWIPEGGGGEIGVQGIANLVSEFPVEFDRQENLIVCACGTGTTIQGLLTFSENVHILSMQVVRMAQYPWIQDSRVKMIDAKLNLSFGKKDESILKFMDLFFLNYGIRLDPVYTAPLLISFFEQIDKYKYKKIYVLHTGGLQGSRASIK